MSHVPVSEAALERALKRRVRHARWTFQANGPAGLEGILADEVRTLVPEDAIDVTSGRVRFETSFDAVYRLALGLRTADALRIRIGEGAAASFPMLRDQLARISWRWWLPPACRLDVQVRVRRSRVRDEAGIERALRQAIADHAIDLRSDEPTPHVRVRLDLDRDRVEVWLDVAGEPLHRRRGDRWSVPGAMRETTAAALVLAARLDDADLIVDPFCGAGTVLEEYASWRSGRCPGEARGFAMESSPAWHAPRMRHARRTLCPEAPSAVPPLLGIDVSSRAIAAARHNLALAKLSDDVAWIEADARSVDLNEWAATRRATRPMVVSNPPYGRRARAHGADPSALVRHLLGGLPGWGFALVSPQPGSIVDDETLIVERVIRFRMRGLANALIVGRVAEAAASPPRS